MSEVKVNKISPRTNCGTVQLGDSGDTITIPAGATITNNGTQTGFGRTGAVDWQTTAKTTSFTAVNGEGYFINSAGGQVTITLPGSPSAGNIVAISDYNNTATTNSHVINRNGNKINGDTSNVEISKNGTAIELVYVDATTGWQAVATSNTTDVQNPFIVATGGTESIAGDFKIHTFTGPGTFSVTNAGAPTGSTTVDYLVVAGGGSGGGRYGGGGGGGGYRESSGTASGCYTRSPLGVCVSALPVSVQSYPIVVGGGAAGVPAVPGSDDGNRGNPSSFSTITSTGGGAGAGQAANSPLGPGGSGGGGSYGPTSPVAAGGSGNTPPVSPPQGSNGGNGYVPNSPYATGGGGGATEVGANASGSNAGRGGAGATSCITGSPVGRSGGGGGSGEGAHGVTAGGASPCGSGTAGSSSNTPSSNGSDNRGGGSGAAYYPGPSSSSGSGGSGVVIIRYKYQ